MNSTLEEPAPPPAETVSVAVQDMSFSYGPKEALKDISLNLAKNQVTAFIGPCGCGKSTLLRCINRMNDEIPGTRVTKGSIHVEGIDIHHPSVDVVKLRSVLRIQHVNADSTACRKRQIRGRDVDGF